MISVKVWDIDGPWKKQNKNKTSKQKTKNLKKKVIWVGMSTNLECEKVRNCSSWHDHLGLILKGGQSQ